MARYKIPVKVYTDPTGKTLLGPTFLRIIGNFSLLIDLIFILTLISSFTEHWARPDTTLPLALLTAGFLALAILLRVAAKKSAQKSYLEALSKMERQEEQKLR